ncbi:hypothetical protein N2152v2_007486 [Parachlorella kessleri]
MYIESWDSFYQQAEELYRRNPLRTRYVTKLRQCDGKLVLKVTDDNTVLQYKTDQQADLKKVDKLNQLFFSLMATGEAPPAGDVEMATEASSQQQQQKRTPQQQQQQVGKAGKTRRKG